MSGEKQVEFRRQLFKLWKFIIILWKEKTKRSNALGKILVGVGYLLALNFILLSMCVKAGLYFSKSSAELSYLKK